MRVHIFIFQEKSSEKELRFTVEEAFAHANAERMKTKYETALTIVSVQIVISFIGLLLGAPLSPLFAGVLGGGLINLIFLYGIPAWKSRKDLLS